MGVASLNAACGIGMSDEDRLDRAAQASADADYQAAIVDAKDVLRRDPQNVRARVILGRASLASGDAASAEKELRRAIEYGANATELHVELVTSLVAQRKFQEALDAGLDPLLDSESTGKLRRLRGDTYQGLKQPAEARREYELALQADPDDVRAHLGIVSAYLAAGNAEQARNNLDVLLDSYPDEIKVWLASGELNRSGGRLDDAESNYQVALGLAGDNVENRIEALYGLAEVAFARGDKETAEARVDELVALSPDSLFTKFEQARLAALNEDWQTAQTILQDIQRRAPEFRPAQLMLGAVAFKTGNYGQGEMYLSAALANEPGNATIRLILAETYLALGQVEDAKRVVSPLASADAADPRVMSIMAKIALSSGDTDLAVSELQRAVEADPLNSDTQLKLAFALIGAGRQDEVAGVLDRLAALDGESTAYQRDVLAVLVQLRGGNQEEALLGARRLTEAWPDQAAGYNLVGSIELANNESEAARSSFLAALDKDPDNAMAERFLAQIEESEGELEGAAARYERIVAGDKAATWAMYGRARVAAANQEFEESAKWLERILVLEPSSMQVRETLARVNVQYGNLDEAAKVANDLVDSDPSRIESYQLLAEIALRGDDFDAAVAALEKARSLDPTSAQVRLRLAEAQRLAGDEAAAVATLGGDGDIDYADLRIASATAIAFADAGNFDRAMEIASGLQRSHPDSAAPIALQGEIWARQNELGKASEAYELASTMDPSGTRAIRHYQLLRQSGDANPQRPLTRYLEAYPDDTVVRQLLAQHLNQSGSTADSISAYEELVDANPDDGVALNNLAWLYYTNGDSRAIPTARKARDAMPDNWAVLDTLGWVLVESGELEEGIDVLQEAEDLSGGAAAVRYHLAVAYARSGEPNTAKQILTELLANKKDFDRRDDAEKLLASL